MKTKTPDEIKKGLECKSGQNLECLSCPYITAEEWYCWCEVMADALAYIKELEGEEVNDHGEEEL